MTIEGTNLSDNFRPPAPDPNWELVGKADRYVYEEGRTARINPDISKVLSPEKVAEVKRMVAQFNNLTDEQYRYEKTFEYGNESATTSTTLATTSTTLATCKDQASAKWRWFGLQITVNECLGRKIIEGVNHPSVNAFLTAIAAIKPLGGLIATAIKIHLAVYKKWMDWASDKCGNKGFEINATWLGIITISRVCKKFGQTLLVGCVHNAPYYSLFMRHRCVGAAVVGVSVKGKPVGVWGLGPMNGRPTNNWNAACADDRNAPLAPVVAPNTPMRIGSISKPVTFAMVRWALKKLAKDKGDLELTDEQIEGLKLFNLQHYPPLILGTNKPYPSQ